MLNYLIPALALAVGAIPTARTVGLAFGADLSRVGTGNIGAGNATRSLGLGAGATIAVLDGLKGLLPVLAARAVGLGPWVVAFTAMCVVIGNNWPPVSSRRGGRGLAASAGIVIGIQPALIVWPAMWSMIGWRIGGGFAGFFGWGLLPFVAVAFGLPAPVLALTSGLALAMIVRRAQGNSGFDRAGAWYRVLYDLEPERGAVEDGRAVGAAHRIGLRFLVPISILLVLYAVGVWWFARGAVTSLSILGAFLLAVAVVSEFGGKWLFGMMFRDGIRRTGGELSAAAAFRAALVGSGVARLIPAGGAVTPVAMSWAVRHQVRGTAGAAVRATAFNYGGMMIGTGGALLWVLARHSTSVASQQTVAAVGIAAFAVGGMVLLGSTRLASLSRLLPRRLSARVTPMLVDEPVDSRAIVLISGRIVCEAATLGLTLAAFGLHLKPSQTVAAFGIAQIVGGLPGSPGGLGITEAGLVGGLAVFGVPAAVALGPVLVFRVVSYWIPAAAGLVAGGFSFLGPDGSAEQEGSAA